MKEDELESDIRDEDAIDELRSRSSPGEEEAEGDGEADGNG